MTNPTICWEVVGRICHLIEDSGVPAHAHNDSHVTYDWFEQYMDYFAHYWEYNYNTAINQANSLNQPHIIEIDNKADPIRFALYTTNQVADRFKSDGVNGDYSYQSTYTNNIGTDTYSDILSQMYRSEE